MALVPLLITPGLFFHYDIAPKIIILALVTAIALLSPREIAEGINELLARKRGRRLCVLAALQFFWFSAANVISTRPWFSLFGSNWRRMGLLTIVSLLVFVLWAAGLMSRDPAARTNVLRSFVIAAIIGSTYGIFQYFDTDPFQSPANYHAGTGNAMIVRPPGTLGNADYFGWWLGIAFFCAIYRTRIEQRFWRWASIAAGVLAAAAIVLSGTRSAMLGVFAGLAVLAVMRFRVPSAKRRRKPVLAGLLAAAIFIAFYISPAGARLRARVRWSADEPIGGARPLLWRDSLHMAAARPWTGFGPETFAAEFPRYQSVQLARLLPDFYHESPHNTLLDALLEEGIPGLLIALGWAALGINGAIKAKCPALAGALTASYVASMFGAITIGPIFATLVIIALLTSLDPVRSGKCLAIKPAVAGTFSIPFAACFSIFGIWLAVGDFNLARFQRSPSVVAYNSAVRTALPGACEDLYCSRILAPVNSIVALQAGVRATTTADNPPNAWYNLAILLGNGNDAAAVERALGASAALAPNWFKPHLALSNLFALTGRLPEARSEAARAYLLDAGKDREVAETFLKLAH